MSPFLQLIIRGPKSCIGLLVYTSFLVQAHRFFLLFFYCQFIRPTYISLPVYKPISERGAENACTVCSSLSSFLLLQVFLLQFLCAFLQRKYNTCTVIQSQSHLHMHPLVLFVYLHQQLLLSIKTSTFSSKEIKL